MRMLSKSHSQIAEWVEKKSFILRVLRSLGKAISCVIF